MIIWLASYPKSGNTWVRSFLSSLIYSNNGDVDFESMKKISQYPLRSHFKGISNNIDDIYSISENWINSQNIINSDKKIKFMKTHHVMCNFGKNSFTNFKNTFGVIQIVRDPRNVITSILNFFSKKNYLEAKEFILDEKKIIGINLALRKQENVTNNQIITLISSWKTHYNSWKTFNKNYLLIKYENLISDPENEFGKIRLYLKKNLNLTFSDEKFYNSIKSNLFLNLKKLENKNGFFENEISKEDKKYKNFFNLGPNNDYKKFLDKKIADEIEKVFKIEMKELGYI